MDNGQRLEAISGANRREGVSAAPPAMTSGVLGGRKVRRAPESGPSTSGTERHATQERTSHREKLRRRLAEVAGTAGHRSRPYSVAERTGRPGAARLQEAGPSAARVAGPSGAEPELPAGFKWNSTYRRIMFRSDSYTQRGDDYAAAASASAVREINQAVRDAFLEYYELTPESQERSPQTMEFNLRSLRNRGKQSASFEALSRSLNGLYRLTHAKETELQLRCDELSAASYPYPGTLPDRQAVEQWLQDRACSVQEAEIERSYFTQLAREVAQGLDPWTVSRRLVRHLPEPGNADQTQRLQDAHGRLVRVMAGRPSSQAAAWDPGHATLPLDFNWSGAYLSIRSQWVYDGQRKDVCAAAASGGALRDIDRMVQDSDIRFRVQRFNPVARCTEETLHSLQCMARKAGSRNQPDKLEAMSRSLNGIYQFTYAKNMELMLRGTELSAASYPDPVAVPDPQRLGQWLQGQADEAHESEIERSYFTQLAQELAQGLDPWTVSRRLIEHLPEPGDTGQAAQLQAAHGRLVQAMASGPPQPQAPPRWCSPAPVEPLSHGSQAPASRRQEIVQRLRGSNRLSEAQVEAFRSAVAAAADTGSLGASGARPVAWAMGLLERIQQNVERPIDEFSEPEKLSMSSDWKQFGELLENLEQGGHL